MPVRLIHEKRTSRSDEDRHASPSSRSPGFQNGRIVVEHMRRLKPLERGTSSQSCDTMNLIFVLFEPANLANVYSHRFRRSPRLQFMSATACSNWLVFKTLRQPFPAASCSINTIALVIVGIRARLPVGCLAANRSGLNVTAGVKEDLALARNLYSRSLEVMLATSRSH